MTKKFNAEVKELCSLNGNEICVDCSTPNPPWASVTYGTFICFDCASSHRSMGVNTSFVKSVNLDIWSEKEYLFMKYGSNDRFRKFLEKCKLSGILLEEIYRSSQVKKYAVGIKEIVLKEAGENSPDQEKTHRVSSQGAPEREDVGVSNMHSNREPMYRTRLSGGSFDVSGSVTSLQESIVSIVSTVGSAIFSRAKAVTNKTTEYGGHIFDSTRNIVEKGSSSLVAMFKEKDKTREVLSKPQKKQNSGNDLSGKWD